MKTLLKLILLKCGEEKRNDLEKHSFGAKGSFILYSSFTLFSVINLLAIYFICFQLIKMMKIFKFELKR